MANLREWSIATGFLRTGADGTATPALSDPDAVRNQVVADTLKIVSTSLLGLSVGCAQCHDHKFEPLPQADYYRLMAFFTPAAFRRDLPVFTAAEKAAPPADDGS